MSLSSKGLRVTTPLPLGKKSKPTILSNNELLPDDWVPTTQILGSYIYFYSPTSFNSSTILISFLKFSKSGVFSKSSFFYSILKYY